MTPTETFIPEIDIRGEEPADVKAMETLIRLKKCTHVRDSRGRVWKIFSWLNDKSVPLNHVVAPPAPQRLVWSRVDCFGRLA